MGNGSLIENLVPVKGTITSEGEPVDHGTVTLLPVDPDGKQAFGEIHQGSFTLNTTINAPGVVIGKYRVQVVSLENIDPSKIPTPDKPPIKIKSLVPEKFNKVETSGLEVEITEGMEPLQLDLEP